MRVLDGVGLPFFCAVGGVQAPVGTVWRQADRYKVPRLVFVNKMEPHRRQFSQVYDQIQGSPEGQSCPNPASDRR